MAASTARRSRLGELTSWLGALREISRTATAGGELSTLLDQVAASAGDVLGFEFCAVFIPDAAMATLVVGGSSGLSENYVSAITLRAPIAVNGQAPAGRAYSRGTPVVVFDIETDPEFAPWGKWALQEGYRSLAAVPLVNDGEVLGTLTGYHRATHQFTPTELDRMSLLANQAALGISSAHAMNELRQANEALLRQRDLLQRSENIHRRFLDVALSSGGVDGIVTSLSVILQRGVVIEDERGVELSARRVDAGFREAIADATQAQAADRAPHPVRCESDDVPVVWRSEVVLENRIVARLWVREGHRMLDELDVRAIEHATLVTALEMLRRRSSLETEHRLRGELLTDMLAGVDDDHFRDRYALLGHDLSRRHIVLVVAPGGGSGNELDRVRTILDVASASVPKEVVPRPLVAINSGVVAVLWPLPLDDQSRVRPDAEEEALTRIYENIRRAAGPVVGVLTTGHSTSSATHALRVAQGALRVARRSGRDDALIPVPELGLGGLLLQLDDAEQLISYVREKLAPISRYDEHHGSELVETLYAYLKTNLDRRSTATRMHIHPNTVLQRLHRIEALIGSDLRNPDTLLELNTALTVRDVVMGGRSS